MRWKTERVAGLWLIAACATPSQAELAERQAEVRRMSQAHAVHMPKGVESCVGVTLRLSDPAASAETVAERTGLEGRLSPEEVAAALAAAGVAACREAYLQAVADGQVAAEPLLVTQVFGVDPAGKVCAVVERERPEAIDPAAGPILDAAAGCLKEALFRAAFPAGRVKDKERIIRSYALALEPARKEP